MDRKEQYRIATQKRKARLKKEGWKKYERFIPSEWVRILDNKIKELRNTLEKPSGGHKP